MFIKKIKIVNTEDNPVKRHLGKSLTVRENKLIEEKRDHPVPIKYFGEDIKNTSEGLYLKVHTFAIPEEYNVPLDRPFHNYLSEFIAPVHINDIAVNDDSKAVSSGYVKAKFNFVSEQYESFSNDTLEPLLPCIYLESDPQQTKTIMDQKVFTRVIPKARDFYDFEFKLKPRYNEPSLEKNKNYLFGQNFSFNIGNSEREQYPFYNNIRFNYKTDNSFKNNLKQFNFFEHFIDDYMNSSKDFTLFRTQVTQETTEVANKTYSSFDILSWLKRSDFSFSEHNKLIFEPTQKYKSPFQYYLDKLSFVGKLRKLCLSKMRNIKDIHNNVPCKTEVMFYRIDKSSETLGHLQSYWVPADDQYIDFVDTQIKYGVKYTYTVNAYVLVFGSTYRYTNRRKIGQDTVVDAIIEPSFKIIEVPHVFHDYCRVIQPPQPVPNVQFVNESSKEDYIKIHLNLAVNSEDLPLSPIEPIDLDQEEMRLDYDRLLERPRFVYNNERALYEIYRLTSPPKSYEDLQGNKIAEIRNSYPSTGVVYKDYIDAWTDYYYVFRSVNIHGLVSNPTPVFQVKMTKDADESFLESKTIPFYVPKTSQPDRTFMKLLQAIPATQHTYYDQEKMFATLGEDMSSLGGDLVLDKLTLGSASMPIWGKKFKFRITSSETGKKIDVNIKVNLIKKKTMENSK